MSRTRFAQSCSALLALAGAAGAQLRVSSTTPPLHAQNVAPTQSVLVQFDRALDPATLPPAVPTCAVSGSTSGPVAGSFALENAGTALRFTPQRAWPAGELVQVALTHALRGSDGTWLRRAGYAWRFRVATAAAPMSFQVADEHDLRDQPGTMVRIYGANTCDLDGDGWIDLAAICEDSADVRVLLSRRDGGCRFQPFLTPVYPTALAPSPNEACDMDQDGRLDLVLADVASGQVSIALGHGDGTFAPRTDLNVGQGPTGLAVFDADGDGDADIVTANSVSDNLSFLRNLGGGAFAPALNFEGGGSGERGLAVDDLDEDGILDLVVAARYSQRLLVLRGNGTGSFTLLSSTYCGGSAWNVALGDLNGDGHVDATVANSSSNSAAVLLGDGLGGFSAPAVYALPAYPVATDLGDLDGDGDLDWIVSCHLGGVWKLFAGNGQGGFTFVRDFVALSNPACAALADLDRDRDLDLVLLDEIADRVTLLRNASASGTLTCSGDGVDASCPCTNALLGGSGCPNSVSSVGARLLASGDPAQDTLALSASGLPASSLAIFFCGDVLQAPLVFGDGLTCAGGNLHRFGQQTAQAGAIAYPPAGQPSLSQASASAPASGDLRVYQAYYRNSAPFCTSATLNLTNGLVVVW